MSKAITMSEVYYIMQNMLDKIADLEAKLAEWQSGRMIQRYQREAEFYSKQAETVAKKFNDLEQQLAEKDKEIKDVAEWGYNERRNAENWESDYYKANQDKISFAVEQLEKVKEWANERYDGWKDNKSTNQSIITGICLALENVGYKINEQIEQLKEGK